MSFDETINAYFVKTTNANTVDKTFDEALELLSKNIPINNIRQLKATDAFPLIASGTLTKNDVFVFDQFEGDFFKQLQQTKSFITGPRCLITCITKRHLIPLSVSPVYTAAMLGLQISATGIDAKEKERLSVLIRWMAGQYFPNFGRSTTHLISNTIKSTKYELATLNGIPVMHTDWVQRVWERSCIDDVCATDEEFDKYGLPIFFGTNITCTGLETDKKNKVSRYVNENGGTYHRAFRSTLVDIVITEHDKTNSDKYQAAVRYKKEILNPDWIFDSVQKGFALPTKGYQVKSLKASTPTKTDQSIADFTSTDHTQLSELSRISSNVSKPSGNISTVNETLTASVDSPSNKFVTPAPPKSKDLQREIFKAGAQYRLVYEEICQKKAKKAGPFLDGCCIYLSGFRHEEREKLNKILNLGSATRYDVLNEEVTHIVVGQIDDVSFIQWKEDGILTSVHIVRLDWLLESIRLKQPASEANYRVSIPTAREPDAPSPSSKRTLRSMNHSFKQTDLQIKKKLFDKDVDNVDMNKDDGPPFSIPIANSTEKPFEMDVDNLISQYSQENLPVAIVPQQQQQQQSIISPPTPSNEVKQKNNTTTANVEMDGSSKTLTRPDQTEVTSSITIDYENLNFFRGMSFFIDNNNFVGEFYSQIVTECEAAQGNIVNATYKDIVDYAIVSFESSFDESTLPIKAHHIITELYVETCLKLNKLVPIEYYHKHIPKTADTHPLKGMTIVISTYTELEKDFIDSISQALGALVNNVFVKKDRPLLICPEAKGMKYNGAIKWNYPVVTSEWLVQCANTGEKLPFKEYLVGISNENFPTSPILHENNTSNNSLNNMIITPARQTKNLENITSNDDNNVATPSPNTNITPLRNKRISELAGMGVPSRRSNKITNIPTIDYNESPERVGPLYNYEFMEKIIAEMGSEAEKEVMRELVNDIRQNQTPELERIRRQACTPRKTIIGIPDFCTTPEFEKRMADAFMERWRLPTKRIKPDTPIDVLRKRVMMATCKAIGVQISDEDDDTSTVATLKKRNATLNATNTNVSLQQTPCSGAKARDSTVTARILFNRSTNNNKNMSNGDGFVPCTQSPNSSGIEPISMMGKSTINFDKISFEDSTTLDVQKTLNNDQTITTATTSTESPEMKRINEYLKNCASRRQSMKRSASHFQEEYDGGAIMDSEAPLPSYVQPFESEKFGHDTEEMVGWRDPDEFSLERRSKLIPAMQYKGTPLFSISCTEKLRDDVIKKILNLGGRVCENLVNYDENCTHFVCERPNRGEKILSCIASGKWVLSLKYIEECYVKNTFIDEELFEWGNCKAVNLPQLTQEEQSIALAAHRWRKQLLNDSANGVRKGAFDNLRTILNMSVKNLEAVRNVIKAGNGIVIDTQPPYCNDENVAHATHCFVDKKNKPISREDYQYLKRLGVKIYSQMYINSYLMNGGDFDFTNYEIQLQ